MAITSKKARRLGAVGQAGKAKSGHAPPARRLNASGKIRSHPLPAVQMQGARTRDCDG